MSERPIPVELSLESSEALAQGLRGDSPAVYVVHDRDLDQLRDHKDVVVDRGKRHPARQLWRYLIPSKRAERSKVPAIDANYLHPGRFAKALQRVFLKARERGQTRCYIVGVGGGIFNAMTRPIGCEHRDDPDAASRASLYDGVTIPEELTKEFIGTSEDCHEVRYRIMCAAASDVPVLILGDTGTGKEVVAGCIHEYSRRKPYTPVNCAAVPKGLFEAILFGQLDFGRRERAHANLWLFNGRAPAGDGTRELVLSSFDVPTTNTPTPTPSPAQCVGDCNGDRQVTVNEIYTLVNIALGNGGMCPNGIAAGATVDVAVILQAVNRALNGCGSPTPTSPTSLDVLGIVARRILDG
jgi:hypothetical protein